MVIRKKLLVVVLATVSFGNIFGGKPAHGESHNNDGQPLNTQFFSKDEAGGKFTEYNRFPKDSDLLLDGSGEKVNFKGPSLEDFSGAGMATPVGVRKISSKKVISKAQEKQAETIKDNAIRRAKTKGLSDKAAKQAGTQAKRNFIDKL